MPQQPGDKIPKAWTIASIQALMEPRIKTLIRRQGDIGGPLVDHDTLGGLADDDHVQYLIDLPGTGGDGITVTSRTISVNLTDNTIMAKVGAAAAGPLAVALNTVVLRAAGDVVALSMPTRSILVRDATGSIKALAFANSRILSMTFSGVWQAQSFAGQNLIVADGLGGLKVFPAGNNKWFISGPTGNVSTVLAFPDWMTIGDHITGTPTFLPPANDAILTKVGTAAVAWQAPAVQQIIGRKAAGLVLHTFTNNSLLGKITGDWANISLAVQQLILRGASDMAATTIGDTRWVGRPVGGNLGEVTPAESRVMLSLLYSSFLCPPGLHADTTTTKTVSADNRLQFVYVGKAGKALTTTVVICEVATAYTLAGGEASPWADIGVYTGSFIEVAGSLTLTKRGITDVSSIFNTTGRKTITVSLTGISEGDDLWIMWGSETNGNNFELRALLPDQIRSGVVQRANTTGDATEQDPATTLVETNTFNPPWIGMTAI